MPERRTSPRVPANLTVKCRWSSGVERGQTINISAGGVLLIVPKKIPAGTRITLEFEPGEPPLELRGLVRHAAEDLGHGIEFVEVLPSQRDALLEFIARLEKGNSAAGASA